MPREHGHSRGAIFLLVTLAFSHLFGLLLICETVAGDISDRNGNRGVRGWLDPFRLIGFVARRPPIIVRLFF
jgi:hypothetical protein